MLALLTVRLCLHDNSLDATSVISSWLQMHFPACRLTSSIYIDGVTLVYTQILQWRLGDFGTWGLCARGLLLPAAQNLHFAAKPAFCSQTVRKPTFLASWRPRRPADTPPGAHDGLPTGFLAPKTAFRRASWRPRQPLHGPPGVCMTTILTKRLSDQLSCR